MHRVEQLLHSRRPLLEMLGDVALVVHRRAISCPWHVQRRVWTLLHGQARVSWWQPWERAMMPHVLVVRRPTAKEAS